jgi:chemotaxis protein CheX
MIEREQIVSSLCRATDEVFATMLGLEMSPAAAYTEVNPSGPTDGVVSFIGLAGAWVGTGSLSCTPGFACQISSQLLAGQPAAADKAVDEEVLDAVAEVTNMIIGNFKTMLEEIVGPLGLSIPTVIFGRNFTARSVGTEEWTVVPFFCGEERLDVKICLTPNREPHYSAKPVHSAVQL